MKLLGERKCYSSTFILVYIFLEHTHTHELLAITNIYYINIQTIAYYIYN